MVMPTDRIQQMLARGQNPTQQGVGPQVQGGGIFSRIDQTLMRPGGSFLLNLLAQEGRQVLAPGQAAFIPGPLGSVARAAQATQQQGRQQEAFDLRRRMLESQIGLNQAQTIGALTPGGEAPKPSTAVGKILADQRAGLITEEQAERLLSAENRSISSANQADTKSLRSEFRSDISGPRSSLSGLAAAEGLLANNNAIADTAAFTSFIRAIDNSVVRPAEQEAYNKALGLRNQIEATVQQWAGKGPLPPQTKQALLSSIRQLRDTMEGIVDRTVDFYANEAVKFDLDPESVTGLPIKFDQQEVPIDGLGAPQQPVDEELDTAAQPIRLRNPG